MGAIRWIRVRGYRQREKLILGFNLDISQKCRSEPLRLQILDPRPKSKGLDRQLLSFIRVFGPGRCPEEAAEDWG